MVPMVPIAMPIIRPAIIGVGSGAVINRPVAVIGRSVAVVARTVAVIAVGPVGAIGAGSQRADGEPDTEARAPSESPRFGRSGDRGGAKRRNRRQNGQCLSHVYLLHWENFRDNAGGFFWLQRNRFRRAKIKRILH